MIIVEIDYGYRCVFYTILYTFLNEKLKREREKWEDKNYRY